jgi:hypothetical protein
MFLNPTSMLLTTLLLAGSTALARPATACEGHGATPAIETAQADAAPAPSAPAEAAAPATADATAGWDALLRAFVTADGGFRYKALAADTDAMAKLRAFTTQVATADTSKLSREEALAFYINAYNATTIAEVLKLWPVTNVLKKDLEKTKIRDPFKEPRIHFLVNCASASCPVLVGEAITAANIESLMARQATEYVSRTTLFPKGKKALEISSIFDWYKEDFGGPEGVRAFIAAHVAPEQRAFVEDSANKIGFFNYDWTTNTRD